MADIKEYWDVRAKTAPAGSRTTNDIFLRKLEASVIGAELGAGQFSAEAAVLDVGCGDGQTLLTLAVQFPALRFHGIDFSQEMISSARDALSTQPESVRQRVSFALGDVRNLDAELGDRKFAAILSNRCLINLTSTNEQYGALRQIAGRLAPEGLYLGTENFIGGQNELNRLRNTMKLPEIAVRWHNLFFEEDEFMAKAPKIFQNVELIKFSSAYYYVTRVVYSSLCRLQGQQPDYEHPIHEVAMQLPPFGDFSPIKLIRARAWIEADRASI
jgi:ubiquinone/menaquinone biosynthesis C-methylase UbiE